MIQKPSALTRFKSAIDFYRYGWRKFQLQPRETKKVPFIWPAWVNNNPQWQLINYEAYANEGFSANAVIYSAIMYKVRSITIAPLRAFTGTTENPELLPPEHPLQTLCMRPNSFQSWSEFQALATVYFNLAGNNYTLLDRDRDGNVVSMYNLRPDRMFILPSTDKNNLVGFWYVPEGKSIQDGTPYLAQDIIHIKLPNPLDPLDGLGYGISPLSPAAHSGEVDNDLTKFFRLFFKAGAMPPGILKYDVPMEDDDVSRARERWMEIYGGYDNWLEPAVLDQGGSYERVGFTFQEMDVSAIDARNESRIVAPFGVPLNLIESRPELVQSTYSNKAEDRTMFWQDTMIPELKWFETDYQYYLQQDNAFVMFDMSQIPALNMSNAERTDRIQAGYVNGAVTLNEYRSQLGLDPIDEPLDTTDNDNMDGQPEAVEQSEDDIIKSNGHLKKNSEQYKLEFWIKSDEFALSFENEFSDAAKIAFEYDLAAIQAIIDDANRDALENRASLNWDTVIAAISVYIANSMSDNWRRNFEKPLFDLMSNRVSTLNTRFTQSVLASDLLAGDWFRQYVTQFAQPIMATTEETIRMLIEQGMMEAWTVPQMQSRLELLFRQWLTGDLSSEDFAWFNARLPEFRLEMIARTETIKAMNLVSTRLYDAYGVQEHEWLATRDNRVRPAHLDADGQIVQVGKPFNVGGESLRFPGDPAGSPGNIINCRCTTIPVMRLV